MKVWHLLIPGALLVLAGAATSGSAASSSTYMERALARFAAAADHARKYLGAVARQWPNRLDAQAFVRANTEQLLELERSRDDARLAGDSDLVERLADQAEDLAATIERAYSAMNR